MQHLTREKVVLGIVVSSLTLFFFTLLVTTKTITNVSAVVTNGVGVYWDGNCTDRVLAVDWGTLQPGSVKDIVVYFRNEVEEPIHLTMLTNNWNPAEASDFITVRWEYTGQQIDFGDTLQIQLTLSVSRYVEGISSFQFDIIIFGTNRLLGDINDDGIVDINDALMTGLSYGSIAADDPTTPWDETLNWNSDADLSDDGRVDMADLVIVEVNFGMCAHILGSNLSG